MKYCIKIYIKIVVYNVTTEKTFVHAKLMLFSINTFTSEVSTDLVIALAAEKKI